MEKLRRRLRVNGVVQGVGFRPFVFRLAQSHSLAGFICNSSEGVLIEVEGTEPDLDSFEVCLLEEPPPLARILESNRESIDPVGEGTFLISDTRQDAVASTMISPDVAVCEQCVTELFDPTDRRYRYPFVNCTNCGPRFSIVKSIPYDRPNTSMSVFDLCSECAQEYESPDNRRFHAQPNACHICGPQVELLDHSGKRLKTDRPISAAAKEIASGRILAVKGIGGFHLAVGAYNEEAIRELRRRKGRDEKPFALMAASLRQVEEFCYVSEAEQKLLESSSRPIVLLEARANNLARGIAPGNRYLGFMLPYTPLHHLLLEKPSGPLVMTSGNYSDEPIAIENEEAIKRLGGIADFFLCHNREILQRCDDSVVRVVRGRSRMIRRSRGHAPMPIHMEQGIDEPILACGGELKDTIALGRGNAVFMSQHVGDLDNPAALEFFEDCIKHICSILEIEPKILAHDLHPEYESTKWAVRQEGLQKFGVQHHHAHLAAVIGENGWNDRAIGVILDGTGYGLDGTIWGGEVLVGDAATFERHAWLQPVALPGGEAAIKQPWRMALSHLYAAYGDECLNLEIPFVAGLHKVRAGTIIEMIEKGINSPLTSSCGRLFDAVAALLGIRSEVSYEAQAAIELEMRVEPSEKSVYGGAVPSGDVCESLALDSLFRAVVRDLIDSERVEDIAGRFHRTLVEILMKAVLSAREKHGINTVGLSGGVFQNAVMLDYFLFRLEQEGFSALSHSHVPANDGGLAFGQLVVAQALARRSRTPEIIGQ
ncbi:MAG TPA: carbamoyltransferase HypF [Acidobacteriota bacterium]|nr:carbamoyltransferase HypF [Acidobacteriota bacterium]